MTYDTKRNRCKLVPKLCKYEVRKQFFVNRLELKLWNILPDEVVSVSSISSFKRHLDGFWCDRDLSYNYKADTQHRKSQCNNSTSKVLVVIRVCNTYTGRKQRPLGLLPDIH